MTTREIAAALTRRRFLLIATAAAGGTLASACAAADPVGNPDTRSGPSGTQPSSAPAASSAPTSSTPGPATSPFPSPAASTVPSNRAPGTSAGPAGPPQPLRGNGSRRTPGKPDAARKALSDFGADFLRGARTLAPDAANTAISPYSLFTVLAMARAGAKGATATQIDTALHSAGVRAQGAVISAVDAGVAAAIAAAEQNAEGSNAPVVITAANQIWVQDDLEVHQDYLDALAVQFGVEAVAADFAADPEKMRVALNAWVAQRTNDLIPELFPDGSIDQSTVVVLLNALYLKAPWAEAFVRLDEDTFVTGDGTQVHPPVMQSIEPLRGVAGKGWTAVTVPYRGGGAAMTLLVPDSGWFEAVLAGLDSALMARAARTGQSVGLRMPLFHLATTAPATDVAASLGIRDIFTSAVDLSGIAGLPGKLIAEAFLHQVVVTVDENGTEAAAATAMGVIAVSAPRIDIKLVVDRPFLFWISETVTGAPLFLGVVTDPTA